MQQTSRGLVGGFPPGADRADLHELSGVQSHPWPPKVLPEEIEGASYSRVAGEL